MYPILYESVTIGEIPDNYGIGVLTDAISCSVTEERNGSYELTMRYPSSGKYADKIVTRAILKVKPNYTDDPQLFRIYKVGKEIGSSFTINARHISYDMSGFPITEGKAASCAAACDVLTQKAHGFSITTDKGVAADFEITEPSSVRSWFGGKTGSLLDVYGQADWYYDNFSAKLLAHRGDDRGVTLRYGKNLTKLSHTDNASNLATGVMAYWKPTEGEDNSTEGELVISDVKSTGITLDVEAVTVLDASSDYQDQPTKETLNAYVENYIASHELAIVENTIDLDFAQISKLLKDRVDLCDTVHIIYEDYNINADAKCITTVWDVLDEKYTSITLGTPKTNIADTIASINKAVNNTLSQKQIQNAINASTNLITGNMGGYVVIHDSNEDGYPDELLIMNTNDITTATKVWRWNLGGLGYSSTGYDGQYGTAMTMDGAINADFVKTGNLVFGGTAGNTDGKLEIMDASGQVIASFNKAGCEVNGSIIATTFKATRPNSDYEMNMKYDAAILLPQNYGNCFGLNIVNPNIVDSYGRQSSIVGMNLQSSADSENTNGSGVIHVSTLERNSSVFPKTYLQMRARRFSGTSPSRAIDFTGYADSNCRSAGDGIILYDEHYDSGKKQSHITVGNAMSATYNSNDSDATYDASMSLGPSNDEAFTVYSRVAANKRSAYMYMLNGDVNTVTFKAADNNYFQIYTDSKFVTLNDGVIACGPVTKNNNSYTFHHNVHADGETGNITCVSLTQTSSKKYKKNITDITEDDAKKILELRPVNYDFIDENNGKNMRGFIAEEVDEIIPEVVRHYKKPTETSTETVEMPIMPIDDNDDGHPSYIEPRSTIDIDKTTEDEVSLDYIMLIPYLTKMIQIQQKQIDDLQKQINELKGE